MTHRTHGTQNIQRWRQDATPADQTQDLFLLMCGLILRVVTKLFVVIFKCGYDFPMVAMGEPDPCREPHPRKVH